MDLSAQLLITALLTLVAIVACAVLARFAWRLLKSADSTTVPVACLLVGFCLESIFVKQPYIQVGLQIYPNDLISLFVLLSVAIGFIYRPLPITEGPFVLWLAFGGTIILSLIVGLDEYGRYAGTEVRPFFYLWVAGLYCCATDFSEFDLRRIGRWCTWSAYAFIAIAIYFWVGIELGFVNRKEVFDYAGAGTVFRPVGSHAAFFVAAVALVQTIAWLRGTGTRFSGWHAVAFIAFVTILQHRSVWIAAAIGLMCVFFLERRHLPKRLPMLLGFALIASLLISLAAGVGYFDELTRRMLQSTLSMADHQGTFAARVDGWERLVETWVESSTETIVFGFPFGRGYTRLYYGQLIEFAPHNFYLDLVLRVGVVGLALFLLATGIAIVHALRTDCASEFEYLLMRGLGVVLLASLVYYIAYPSYYILGGATGVALSHVIRQRRAQDIARQSRTRPARQATVGRMTK
jgi:hypothetical protein